MQDTWYLFPGQKLETTKIKDRGKALVASKDAWKSVTDHLRRKQYQQEIIDEDVAKRNYLKEGSKNMTKNWDNSLEKIQERRMRDLTMKAQLREENLVRRYLELRAEQQAERDIILSQLSRKLYLTTEKPRELNTALLKSETLFERNLQVEFNKKLREHEKIEEMKEAMAIKYNAEQEVIENTAKAKLRKEINVKHCEELKQQIKETQELMKKTREEKIKNELIDIERGNEEYEEIMKWEKDNSKKQKDDVKKEFHEFILVQKEIREENERQDNIQDKIIKICEEGKCKIDSMKKVTAKNARDEQLAIRSKIAEKLISGTLGNEAEEEQRMANQRKELEEKENEIQRKKDMYQQKLKKEKAAYLKLVKITKAKEADDKNEIKKWEFLNRLKTMEVMEKYDLDKLQKLFDEKMKYRRILNKQKNEINNRKLLERKLCYEAEMKEIRDKVDFDDKQFFEYAKEVYDIAKNRGRDTYPIQRVIDKYKKETSLIYKPGLPPKKDPRNLISSIQIGVPDKKPSPTQISTPDKKPKQTPEKQKRPVICDCGDCADCVEAKKMK